MKLRMNQSLYIDFRGGVVDAGQVIDFPNVKQAEDFIKVGYAELVVDETPVKEEVKEVKEVVEAPVKPKKPRKKKEVKGDE